jgi:hypothetical protein
VSEREPIKAAECEDCHREYPFGLDMTFPFEQWKMVSSSGDDGGILCPSCMVDRAAKIEGAIAVRAQIEIMDAARHQMYDSAAAVLEREPDLWHVVRWFVGLAVESTDAGWVYPEFALQALSNAMGRDTRQKTPQPTCRFGDGPACGLFETPAGCACFPGDTHQYLCCYHAEKFPDGFPIKRLDSFGDCK